MPSFYEFFAGGGMARIGLGSDWHCEFANDISEMKAASYRCNFQMEERAFAQIDIKSLKVKDIPGNADLVWGSFPCQDLSLAGNGEGLKGSRSGLIWQLLKITKELRKQGRPPKALVLENVTGLLSSNQGQDFYEILRALRKDGFFFGTLMMDAVHFLPQSRPRVFLVAVDSSQVAVAGQFSNGRKVSKYPWTTSRLDRLWKDAPRELRDNWIWWNVPAPPPRRSVLQNVIDPDCQVWDSHGYTEKLLNLMAPLHRRKIEVASSLGSEIIGTMYRRTRVMDGERSQRVEVRFDGISGCLRTPSGGSSRQRLLFVEGKKIRSRLISAREAARLMGVPEDYSLPKSYNDGYRLAGDGVAVPVVKWLSSKLLLPLLSSQGTSAEDEVQLLYA